ncbi:J domain-containing protein [Waterburya agarophytonicola K14]|uniref:J domain-containing protein n=1 Tax=Waterburya agarophytonicola KI4 TaxID=2874699 RepID=A0A964FFT3_9CYAN|nr:J domain-containing protein [Waterburya agarophytonicola]MCC0177266.1 J domain-containing protein [Waterburya agarophytonicola KI4]
MVDFNNRQRSQTLPPETRLVNSYYGLMDLHPSASTIAIRRAYRQLSKKYHPDTTKLPPNVAVGKFQRLNEAYAVLSSPEARSLYDLKIGYSRVNVIQAPSWSDSEEKQYSRTAYLDPTDRPLSSGEIFMLVLLALTFAGCLVLVVVVSYFR